MRTIAWCAGLLLLSAGQARADISDSGSLLISGNGVLQGTMTVQGNAFSVGSSSFSVSAGKAGIGTSSPTGALQVVGSASVAPLVISTGTAGSQEVLRVTSGGGLGIGVTDVTNYKVRVKTATNHHLLVGDGVVIGGVQLSTLNDANSANVGLELQASAFNFTVGNVGIAKSNPSTALDVTGAGTFSGALTVGGTFSMGASQAMTSSSGYIILTPAAELYIRPQSGATHINDSTSGNVTIAAGGGKVRVGDTTVTASTFSVKGEIESTGAGFRFPDSTIQASAAVLTRETGAAINTSGLYAWAKSTDGATQSSGCIVAVSMNVTTPAGIAQFTSTTTVLNPIASNIMPGVLLETCAAAAVCRVGLDGLYRVFGSDAAGTSYASNQPTFSTTRCKVTGTTSVNGNTSLGYFLNAASDATTASIWIRLGR